MEKAARDPEYLVVSDWTQYTSDDYWKISTDSGMLVLYVYGRRLLNAPFIFPFHTATNRCNSCLDSILVNGKGEVYCPGQKFLQAELAPGLVDDAFPPGTEVSDKG